jgi:hypothetical protein
MRGLRVFPVTNGRPEESAVHDERCGVSAEPTWMEAVGAVERKPSVAAPGLSPGAAGGEELGVGRGGGAPVRRGCCMTTTSQLWVATAARASP